MRSDSGQTISFWMATNQIPSTHPLATDMHADVCVVGAGIAGMTTAYMLAREGKRVVVLDDGPIGGGETGRTTAHLSNALDDRYYELERLFGGSGARLAAQSHTAAIDRIEAIVASEKIECDFERLDGYLFVPPDCSTQELERELDAAHRAGLSEVDWVARAPIADFDTGPALRFPRQAQFDPLKYLNGLARKIMRGGGRIFTGTHAEEIQGGAQAYVKTSRGATVTARAVVVATNSPVNDLLNVSTKQHAYRTYVIGALVPRGSVQRALYWDTPDPYHYVRIQSVGDNRNGNRGGEKATGYDVLIVGGEDHKSGEKDDGDERFAELYRWTRRRFPMIGRIEFQWSGHILEPSDSLAFIGRHPQGAQNLFIATGDSGHGMTHGTIAGMLITDLIQGRPNDWSCLYDPSRLVANAALDYIRDNATVLSHYTDWLTGGEVDSVEEIKPGEGCLIRRGLTKIAAYRDEHGVLHERQAICQHLGCAVAWNSTEKSWDCPCHGSRYDPLGRVINGPAIKSLVRANE